jgi:hypothetical protein
VFKLQSLSELSAISRSGCYNPIVF